jgi:hypothetical protein
MKRSAMRDNWSRISLVLIRATILQRPPFPEYDAVGEPSR